MTKSAETLIRQAMLLLMVGFCLWLFYDRVDERDLKTLFSFLVGGIGTELGLSKISSLISDRRANTNEQSPE